MSNVEHVWQNELAAAEKQNENMAVDAVPSSWTMVVPTPTTAGENVAPRPLKVAGPITTAPLPPAGQQPATTAPIEGTPGFDYTPAEGTRPNYSSAEYKGPVLASPSGEQRPVSDGTLQESPQEQVVKPQWVPGRYVQGVKEPPLVSEGELNASEDEWESAWLDRHMADVYTQSAIEGKEKALQKHAEDFGTTNEEYNKRLKEIDARNNAAINAAKQKYESSEVDPTKFINNMSTGQKIMSILALLLGGVGAALTRSDRNLALEVLQQQIDRDVEAQKVALEKNRDLYNDAVKRYGSEKEALRQWYIDRVAVIDKTLAMGQANADTDLARAQLADTRAKLKENSLTRLRQVAGDRAALRQAAQPTVRGGGYTPGYVVNADKLIAGAVAGIADPKERMEATMKLYDLLRRDPQKLVGVAGTMANNPNPTGAAATSAQQQKRQQIEGELDVYRRALLEALAADDTGAAQYLSSRVSSLEHTRDTGAEQSDAANKRESVQYQGIFGEAADALRTAFGGDSPSERAQVYINKARAATGRRQGGQ